MPRNSPPDVGRKIKMLRAEKKLTLEQLTSMSGVSKSMRSGQSGKVILNWNSH